MYGTDELRQHCWIHAREAFGTSHIFQRRIRGPRRGLKWVTYLGLAIPLAIGLLVLGFGLGAQPVARALPYAAALLVVQGLVALWALVGSWQSRVDDGLLSITENNRLSTAYRDLATRAPLDLETRIAILDPQYQARSELDLRQGVTDVEKRVGMRAALRQFASPCAACGQVPSSMVPTSCGVCGDFPRRLSS